MEKSIALLTLCKGNPPVIGGFPSTRASKAQLWHFLWCPIEKKSWTNNRVAGDLRRRGTHVTPLYLDNTIAAPASNGCRETWTSLFISPDSKVHGANMGPTWVLSAPDGTHVGPMNLVIRELISPAWLLLGQCVWAIKKIRFTEPLCSETPHFLRLALKRIINAERVFWEFIIIMDKLDARNVKVLSAPSSHQGLVACSDSISKQSHILLMDASSPRLSSSPCSNDRVDSVTTLPYQMMTSWHGKSNGNRGPIQYKDVVLPA